MATGLRRGVDVRAPAASDAPELARLLAAGPHPPDLRTPDLRTPDAREMAGRLEALAQDPAAAALVATDAYGSVIGLAALGWAHTPLEARPVARLTALVVAEEERRRGIGRLLLKACAQLARTEGCDALELAGGDEAAPFCQATGFEAAGRVWRRGLRRRGAE